MRRSDTQNQIPRRKFPSPPRENRTGLLRHCSTAKRTIEENPLVATLAVFGVGLAVGSVVGGLLADAGRGHEPTLSDRIQRRMSSVLSDMIPHSLEQRLHR